MTKTELRAKYEALKAAGKLHGSVARAVKLRVSREGNPPVLPSPPANRIAEMARQGRIGRAVPVIVPLGKEHAGAYLSTLKRRNPRYRNWRLGAEAGYTTHTISTGSNTNWNKKSTFRRGAIIESVTSCSDFRLAVYTLAGKEYRVPAPRGYRWGTDANGLKLRNRNGDDYHPDSNELIAAIGDKCAAIIRKIKENAETRKAEKAKEKQRLAAISKSEKEGATVCLADSLRAGNCRAGSTAWATRHGLNPTTHVSPKALLAMANGDTSRVALVVTVALRRHKQEMERGYAILAEHRA